MPTDPLPFDPIYVSSMSPPTDTHTPPISDPLLIIPDSAPTPSSLFTTTKTSHRDHFAAALQRMGLPAGGNADVLLWNDHGYITETPTRNVAFFRDGRWLTPNESTGCLQGVVRRWLLENKRIFEDKSRILTVEGAKSGEIVMVFNAVKGCRFAVIHLRR
jgi:4-amino-4-deoxychorismate lyase